MISLKTNLDSKVWPLEEPASGPGLHLPPGLPWACEEDYVYLLLNCNVNFKSPAQFHPPSFKNSGAAPSGPYYEALMKDRYLIRPLRRKRICICPDCCRLYGSSGEEARTARAIKIRREKQRVRRAREARLESDRLRRIMLAEHIASSEVERDFKRALKSTFLRGGSLPKNAAEYIRRLAHYRASVKLYKLHMETPFCPLWRVPGEVLEAPKPKPPTPKQERAPKPKRARRASAQTDEAQAFIGPRMPAAEPTPAISQEKRQLLRKIRTMVRLEREALRSSNPLDQSLAVERLISEVKKDLLAARSRVGDFRFNINGRLSKSIAAVLPLYET